MVRAGVLGLATHNLPLVRHFLSAVDEVLAAEFVSPFGYQLTFRSGNRIAQLLALMPGQWRPDWSLRVWGREVELQVQFPPFYALAGSATGRVDPCDFSLVLALCAQRLPSRVAASSRSVLDRSRRRHGRCRRQRDSPGSTDRR
jgi:hypothetical protein